MKKDSRERLLEVMQVVNPDFPISEAEGNLTRLNTPMKKKINTQIRKAIPTYSPEIPLQDIEDILKNFGLLILQEDFTPWSGMLTGADAQANFEMAYFDSAYQRDDMTFYVPIENAGLMLSWYKMESMESSRYEIVTYVA
jgi:hypothetical protein